MTSSAVVAQPPLDLMRACMVAADADAADQHSQPPALSLLRLVEAVQSGRPSFPTGTLHLGLKLRVGAEPERPETPPQLRTGSP